MKRFGTKLHGKITAGVLREHCSSYIKSNSTLVINMAGIKDVTPGFALECFGKLYIETKQRGARLEFSYTPKHLRSVLLSSIKAALN